MSTEELLPVLIVALAVAFIVILGMALALVYARGKRAGARGTLAGGQLPVGSGDADGRQVGAQVLAGQLQAVMSRLDQINQHAAEARGRDEERRQRDDKAHQWLENIAAILLGSASIGKMGERIVGEALAALPPEWVVTDFKVGDAKVEFAIKLPDGKILPIDSKMPAQSKLVELLKNIE